MENKTVHIPSEHYTFEGWMRYRLGNEKTCIITTWSISKSNVVRKTLRWKVMSILPCLYYSYNYINYCIKIMYKNSRCIPKRIRITNVSFYLKWKYLSIQFHFTKYEDMLYFKCWDIYNILKPYTLCYKPQAIQKVNGNLEIQPRGCIWFSLVGIL